MNIRLKKLNQSGFDHMVLLVVFIVLFGLIGSWLLYTSLAATTYVELHAGSGGPCVNGPELAGCSSGSNTDVWVTLSGSSFQIKDRAGQCVDDWNAGIQENPESDTKAPDHTRVPIRMNSCYSSSDKNQYWSWYGNGIHELRNKASGGCINVLGATGTVMKAGSDLGVYSCNGGANEQFYETSVKVSSSGGSSNQSAPAGYLNPMRGVPSSALEPTRIDQGVDYDDVGSGSYPIYAIGPGKVTNVYAPSGSGWGPDNVYISYKLTEAPVSNYNVYIYVAEDCTPKVSVGQTVSDDTALCDIYPSGEGIETGFSQPTSSGDTDLTMAHSCYIEGDSTTFGEAYDVVLTALGAPGGRLVGTTQCSLPSDYTTIENLLK